MKKSLFLPVLMLSLSTGALTGCGKTNADFHIGISQYVAAEALNKATQGFSDKLRELMAGVNKTVDISVSVAAADSSILSQITSDFVNKKKDLILANATPCLISAFNATENIPIIGTSVTDYCGPLGVSDVSSGTGMNVTGTTDLAPLDEQAQVMTSVLSSVEKFGLLYCAAESNSLFQIERMEQELTALGKEYERIVFSSTNDLATILEGKIENVGALFVPTDNTCADAAKSIGAICSNHSKPIFAGEEGICRDTGGALTLSIDYYELGQISAQQAFEILINKEDIKTMPIRSVPSENVKRKYNKQVCEEYGITVPEGFEEL